MVAQHGLNIDAIKRLTGRIPLSEDDRAAKSCIELSVRGSLTDEERSTMQEGFMNLSEIGLDVSFQKDDIYRRSRRLICFDMDSTLIETEVIDELAERAGVGDAVREITARAMRGEIDFRESFTERVALLKGLDVSVMEEIARNLPITEGLERMMTILKRVGYKTAILSGGFTYFGNYLRQKYGFDYVYANELEIEQGKLTGRYVGEVVDGRRKAELLRLLCQFEEINIAQSVAVGDGANDLPMLNLAGLGIAFHAKPKVVANAKQSINTIGLDGVLYFPPVHFDHRPGRHPLFPRPEGFTHRTITPCDGWRCSAWPCSRRGVTTPGSENAATTPRPSPSRRPSGSCVRNSPGRPSPSRGTSWCRGA